MVDEDGNSALHLALSALLLDTAIMLLKANASPLLVNYAGKTPLFTFFKATKGLQFEQLPVYIFFIN